MWPTWFRLCSLSKGAKEVKKKEASSELPVFKHTSKRDCGCQKCQDTPRHWNVSDGPTGPNDPRWKEIAKKREKIQSRDRKLEREFEQELAIEEKKKKHVKGKSNKIDLG